MLSRLSMKEMSFDTLAGGSALTGDHVIMNMIRLGPIGRSMFIDTMSVPWQVWAGARLGNIGDSVVELILAWSG